VLGCPWWVRGWVGCGKFVGRGVGVENTLLGPEGSAHAPLFGGVTGGRLCVGGRGWLCRVGAGLVSWWLVGGAAHAAYLSLMCRAVGL